MSGKQNCRPQIAMRKVLATIVLDQEGLVNARWEDASGDGNCDIREITDSVEQASGTIQRILTGSTWTPDDAEEIGGERTEPAYAALVRDAFDGDIVSGLLGSGSDEIVFHCDDGVIVIERE